MSVLFGIDVSHYQGKIDWKEVAQSGVEAVIIRAGLTGYNGGLTLDDRVLVNIRGCVENNLPFGLYFYALCSSPAIAAANARLVTEWLDSQNAKSLLSLPVYYDIEESFYYGNRASENTEIVISFCNELEENGYFVGVYSFQAFFDIDLKLEDLTRFSLWYAAWMSYSTFDRPGSVPFPFDGHQFTVASLKPSTDWQTYGEIPGIQTDIDLNIFKPELLENVVDFYAPHRQTPPATEHPNLSDMADALVEQAQELAAALEGLEDV